MRIRRRTFVGVVFLSSVIAGCATQPKVRTAAQAPAPAVSVPKQVVAARVFPAQAASQTAAALKIDSSIPQPRHYNLTDDVRVFRDIVMFDLDQDGSKELFALYTNLDNQSAVKVITVSGVTPTVIYQRVFPGQDIKIEMQNSSPVLVCTEPSGFFARKTKRLYIWSGQSF